MARRIVRRGQVVVLMGPQMVRPLWPCCSAGTKFSEDYTKTAGPLEDSLSPYLHPSLSIPPSLSSPSLSHPSLILTLTCIRLFSPGSTGRGSCRPLVTLANGANVSSLRTWFCSCGAA